MVVSNSLFDIVLFGALLLAAFVDGGFPITAGAATLVAAGAATYFASQEWSDALLRRRWWSQESLATAISLSTLGFIYFWWRNESDLALLVLSISLMMASLMVAIALIAALGATIKERDPRIVTGLLLTFIGAWTLGLLGGVLVLFLGGGATIFAKVIVIGTGLFVWKLRELIVPPAENARVADEAAGEIPAATGARNDGAFTLPNSHTPRWALIPRGGTLLDRFLPILVLSAVVFVAARQMNSSDFWNPTPPAAADPNAERELAAP